MPMSIAPYCIITIDSHLLCLLDFETAGTRISGSISEFNKCAIFLLGSRNCDRYRGSIDDYNVIFFLERVQALIEIGMEVENLNAMCNV